MNIEKVYDAMEESLAMLAFVSTALSAMHDAKYESDERISYGIQTVLHRVEKQLDLAQKCVGEHVTNLPIRDRRMA